MNSINDFSQNEKAIVENIWIDSAQEIHLNTLTV